MQGYFVGVMYDQADWRRQANVRGWLSWTDPQFADPDGALARIPLQVGELADSLVEASAHASIDAVCQAVEAACDELRERVFDQIAKVD
jgi:hypothetical protein